MVGRCPYLGLDGNRNEVFLVPSPRHRCYVRDRPERIGNTYQAETCLTSAFRRCPRLMAGAVSSQEQASQAEPPAIAAGGVEEAGRPVRYTELEPITPAKKPRGRHPTNVIEFLVLGLGVSILLAFLFIGYALAYRLQVGPGMEAVPVVAGGPALATTQATLTLVPTFTPTASPTPVVATETPRLPTPIPEPALPTPTPPGASRPPADSPPTRLVIPKIKLDIPVLSVGVKTIQEGGKTKKVWADVPNAGGFHQTSAYPGNPGNTVINGHRDIFGAVFRHLDRVEVGDEITLYVGEVAYPYEITEILIVPETFASAAQRAENLRLIGYAPEERLTLITCTPVGLATHRLLVIAKPPDQVLPEMPEAGSGAGVGP